MKHWLACCVAGLMCLAVGTVQAQQGDAPEDYPDTRGICPALPADAGLQWRVEVGPDFFVCRANTLDTGQPAFGVYLGYFPSFHPDRADYLGRGEVAGRKVRWYATGENKAGRSFGRETVVKTGNGGVAHLWLTATSQAELDARLRVVAAMRFRR